MTTLRALLNWLNTPIHSVRLMRLHPNSTISPHRDVGLCHEMGAARLHLPLSGSNGVAFWVDGYQVPMGAGELWYVNAHVVHSVKNLGAEPRVSLVIDCLANERLTYGITTSAELVEQSHEIS
jgi:hypothetical protein